MEIHQLKYVLAIAKNRSFVRAANELSITPPALSQQVKKLEEELGVTLFERTTRVINLTPAGETFVKYAQEIISSLYDIHASMNQYLGSETGNISLGIFPASEPFGILSIIKSFQQTYPHVNVDLFEDECKTLHEMMEKGMLDASFCTISNTRCPNCKELEHYPLVHDELVLVTSSYHPFANKKLIKLIEAKDEDFIMPLPSSGAYIEFMDICKSIGMTPKIKYHPMSNLTRFGLIAEGLGISFSSSIVATSYMVNNITSVKFEPTVPRTLNLVFHNDKRNSNPVLLNFIEYCKSWAENRPKNLNIEINDYIIKH